MQKDSSVGFTGNQHCGPESIVDARGVLEIIYFSRFSFY